MDATQAIRLVRERLDVEPLAAIHQTFGHYNVTYEVILLERSVIVRMNQNAQAFASTAKNMATLAALGLPLPTLLAVDVSRQHVPFAYMILDKIPGRDLRYQLGTMTFAQMTRLATQIVGFQRQVGHLAAGHGYGYVGIGETGPHLSWEEVVLSESQQTTAATPETTAPLQARVQRQKGRFASYLRSVPPTCFLDDITVKNVIVQKGELQGLVDFDCVCYGDPLYWLALTATGVVSDVGMREWFYIEELKCLWEVSPEQESILALYAAEMALAFLRRCSASETPEWNARMRAAVEQWLTQAEQSP